MIFFLKRARIDGIMYAKVMSCVVSGGSQGSGNSSSAVSKSANHIADHVMTFDRQRLVLISHLVPLSPTPLMMCGEVVWYA